MPSYPTPPTSDHVDDYHGTVIADPYRPLEDSDSPGTRAWIDAQNVLTASVLDGHEGRAAIRSRLTELWDYPRAGAPWRRGDRWFQLRNTGLQDQDVLWTADSPDAVGRVLFDPNLLSGEGTTALTSVAVDDAGEHVALGLSQAGSDWRRWRVRDVETGEELPDRVEWSKFSSAAWTIDGAGFFYGCYPEPPVDAAYDAPNVDMELRYHRLGTDPAGRPADLLRPKRARVGLRACGLGRRSPARGHHLAGHGSGEPYLRRRPCRRRRNRSRPTPFSTRPMRATTTSRRSIERSTSTPTATHHSAA